MPAQERLEGVHVALLECGQQLLVGPFLGHENAPMREKDLTRTRECGRALGGPRADPELKEPETRRSRCSFSLLVLVARSRCSFSLLVLAGQPRATFSAWHCGCSCSRWSCLKLAALARASDRRPFVIVGPPAALSVKGADDDELDDSSTSEPDRLPGRSRTGGDYSRGKNCGCEASRSGVARCRQRMSQHRRSRWTRIRA